MSVQLEKGKEDLYLKRGKRYNIGKDIEIIFSKKHNAWCYRYIEKEYVKPT